MLAVLSPVVNAITTLIGKINWKSKRVMTPDEFDIVRDKLSKDYYIILTRHNGHMSTYAISLAHWFMEGDRGYYAHAFMNLEDKVQDDKDYRFIEATGTGVHYSEFKDVFDDQCSSVALLKPKALTMREWTDVMDHSRTYLGRRYDTLFDLANDQALSCVEVVRDALKILPTYDDDFADFERRIKENKNLDPQMFWECTDFEVVYEIRH